MTSTDSNVYPLPLRGTVPVPGSPGWFMDTQNRLLLRTPPGSKSKAPEEDTPPTPPVPVLEWLPEVLDLLVSPAADGTVSSVHYRVRVGEDVRVVTAADLRKGEIWDTFPAAEGVGTRTVRDVLHNVVRRLSLASGTRTTATMRTGWHPDPEAPEARVYVRHDGTTVPEGRPLVLVNKPDARVVELAAPYPGTAPDTDQVRATLAEIATHGGWAPLVTLGTGARSFGQSIRPVAAPLVITGDPGTGKTCCTSAARSLSLQYLWPPPSTVRFNDTPTHMEFRLDSEADAPVLVDDLALTAEAGGGDVAEANRKLEKIIRSLGNGEGMRGRQSRDVVTPHEMRYVRSPVMITAQTLPPTMQASLYRRSVLLYLTPGDVDPTWWGGVGPLGEINAARVAPALREIGDRIIRRLAEAEGAEAARILDRADARALDVLAPEVTRVMPDWSTAALGMAGVVRNTAGLLGGLVLVAEAAGVEPEALLRPVARGMAASLVRQRYVMEDRNSAADDLGTALGDVIRHALASGRAHVVGPDGKATGAELVPGRSPAELGVTAGYGGEWTGRGLPLIWLPDRKALGVQSANLHTLCAASPDPRVQGYTVRSLPPAVLRAGACHRSTQKGQGATSKVHVPGYTSKIALILLRPEIIWPDLAAEEEAGGPDQDPTPAPEGPRGAVVPLPLATPEETTAAAPPPPRGAPEEAPAVETPPVRSAPRPAPAPSGVLALGADTDGLVTHQGRGVELAHGARDLGTFLDRVTEVMPTGGTVAITAELAVSLGYPDQAWKAPEKPNKRTKWPVAYEHAARLGWKGSQKGVTAWCSWWAEGKPSVTLVVLEWLKGHARKERVSGEDFLRHTDTVAEAAYLLGSYRARVGEPYRMTAGATGVAALRSDVSGRGGATPTWKWEGTGTPAEDSSWEVDARWMRDMTPEEEAHQWAHSLDARMMYLAAMRTTECARRPLVYAGRRAFNKRRMGYWRIPARSDSYAAPDRDGERTGPPLVTGHPVEGWVWVATPTMTLLVELGMVPAGRDDLYEAYLPPGDETGYRFTREFSGRLLDAYLAIPADTTDPEEARIRGALKATYRETAGMLRRGTPFVKRPDWQHTIVSAARANMMRKIIKANRETGVWPVLVKTDAVWYTSEHENPEKLGFWYDKESAKRSGKKSPAFPRGEKLGDYRHEKTLTQGEFFAKLESEKEVM